MKKILLIAAFGVTGLVSAKDNKKTVEKSESKKEVVNLKETKELKRWIANIKVITSCGLPAYISWDTDWGIDCLMSDAAAADYLTCHD
ncbi:hypothetical protein [Chryseobacterium taihuense]|uniref:Uncharacterized protein n=1 Tax=Chryseobacterium taihuense TaxID=1141221 RepID=A0ABY0QVP7_9FLAO|nr:hypothetical protein [Chryseobacterium taihuense]SDL98419.1 hypothetical protein SAMN05216273_11016 [Chryseobacterium taihuense]